MSDLPILLYGIAIGAIAFNFFTGDASFSLCIIGIVCAMALLCVLGGGLNGKAIKGKKIDSITTDGENITSGAVLGSLLSVILSLIPLGWLLYGIGALCLVGGAILNLVFKGDKSKQTGLRGKVASIVSLSLAVVILLTSLVTSLSGTTAYKDDSGRLKYVKYDITVPDGAIPDGRKYNVVERDGGIDITVEGLDHIELEKPVTISFKLKNKVSPADIDHYVAMYTDSKGNTYYYTPDRDKLINEGIMEFETCHFSFFSAEKISDKELAEKAAAELAAMDVVRDKQKEMNKNVYWPYMTELYKKMGITDDTVAGKLARTALDKFGNSIKDDQVKLGFGHKVVTMTTLMADGDMSGMCGLFSQVAFESLAENWGDVAKNYGGAIAGALPGAVYSAIVEEKPAEAAVDVMKAIAVTCCPTITYYQLAADLAEMAVETWKDGEMERLYEIYRGDEIEGKGGFYGKRFDEVVTEDMKGFYYQYMRDYKAAFCSLYGFDPEDLSEDEALMKRVEKSALTKLEQDFKARLEKDTEISKKKQEYLIWIKACEEYDRQNPDAWVKLITRTTISSGFGPYDDMTLRVRRLTNIRDRILDLIKKKTGGATLEQFFETSNVDKQNQELAHLTWLYISSSSYPEALKQIEESYYFKEWEKNHASKGGKWVLVDTIYEPLHETVVETGDAWEMAKNKKITFWRNGATVFTKHEEDGYIDFVNDVGYVKNAYTFEELYTATYGGAPKSFKEGEKISITLDISHCGEANCEENTITKHATTYASAYLIACWDEGLSYGSIPAFGNFTNGVDEYIFRPELYGLNETYSCTMYAIAPEKEEVASTDYYFAIVCTVSQDNYWQEVVRYIYHWSDK